MVQSSNAFTSARSEVAREAFHLRERVVDHAVATTRHVASLES
jgi:hypothetical protein